MEAAVKSFFSSPRFAVAGASSDPRKFGNKIFSWYIRHNLLVTAINPNCSSISLRSTSYNTVPSPASLPAPTETSLSIVTPPPATLKILKEAKKVGIPAVWLQPGSYDEEGLEYAKREFKAGVGGNEGAGGEGWCVLAHGDWGLQLADRDKLEEGKL